MIPKGQTASMIAAQTPAIDYSMFLDRGLGHAKVGTTRAGVNGLFDMGANVWEWVETGDERSKGTRGVVRGGTEQPRCGQITMPLNHVVWQSYISASDA